MADEQLISAIKELLENVISDRDERLRAEIIELKTMAQERKEENKNSHDRLEDSIQSLVEEFNKQIESVRKQANDAKQEHVIMNEKIRELENTVDNCICSDKKERDEHKAHHDFIRRFKLYVDKINEKVVNTIVYAILIFILTLIALGYKVWSKVG